MTKVIDVREGDRWTRQGQNWLWLYRGERCWAIHKDSHNLNGRGAPASERHAGETDLPTPEAFAQLRKWGYEVRGEEPPLTESRVREIFAEMLAAHRGLSLETQLAALEAELLRVRTPCWAGNCPAGLQPLQCSRSSMTRTSSSTRQKA